MVFFCGFLELLGESAFDLTLLTSPLSYLPFIYQQRKLVSSEGGVTTVTAVEVIEDNTVFPDCDHMSSLIAFRYKVE